MAPSRLKTIRLRQHLTQQQMADLLFIEQSSFSKYENKQMKMSEELIQRVATTFNEDAEALRAEHTGSIYFENGSITNGNGIGHVQNYYHVPKELLDSMIQSQEAIVALLAKLEAK